MRKLIPLVFLGAVLSCLAARADEPKHFTITQGFLIAENSPELPTPRAVNTPQQSATTSLYASRIRVDVGNGTTDWGSGVSIHSEDGRTLILTNRHVVSSGNYPITVYLGGKAHRARYIDSAEPEVVNSIPYHPDLSLIEIAGDYDFVKMADKAPAIGEAVWLVGFGGSATAVDAKPVLRTGQVLPLTLRNGWTISNPTLYSSIPIVNGDSGSGIFDKTGLLVGIAWGGDGVTARGEPVTSLKKLMIKERVAGLFPRIAAKRQAAKAASMAEGLSLEAIPPSLIQPPAAMAPVSIAPFPDPPQAAPVTPVVPVIPPSPPGPGWQWDPARKIWWKYNALGTPVQATSADFAFGASAYPGLPAYGAGTGAVYGACAPVSVGAVYGACAPASVGATYTVRAPVSVSTTYTVRTPVTVGAVYGACAPVGVSASYGDCASAGVGVSYGGDDDCGTGGRRRGRIFRR